jgi:DNA-directed RNA polymerase specialized sigma24 family protein
MTSNVTRGALRSLLMSKYEELKRVLARRLGSLDVATDVLHDTYLRLERFDEVAHVANPQAYLFRMALAIWERAALWCLTSQLQALISRRCSVSDPA